MLECHACLRRCLTALLSTHPTTLPFVALRRIPRRLPPSSPFHSAASHPQEVGSWASSRVAHADVALKPFTSARRVDTPGRPQTWGETEGKSRRAEMGRVQSSKWRKEKEIPNDSKRQNEGFPTTARPPEPFAREPKRLNEDHLMPDNQKSYARDPKRLNESFLTTELKYLRDPMKLADHIAHVLKSNDEEKAQALVRLSSKAIANTVSWNHLIDWQMKQGKTKAAFETYNDMKKRAQRPDGYTYTILLRGLADFAHHPQSLGKALSIYHGMFAPNSKITPNIVHVNAVLKVCVRAADTDSMWDIISKLPERGPLAADSWTFSTVINHMRYEAMTNPKAAGVADDEKRESAIVKGRQIWGIIIARWRRGDLKLDEGVVNAMGNLLLIGSRPRDWDDVLSLVSQTTQVPRLVPKLGSTVPAIDEPRGILEQSTDLREAGTQQHQYDPAAGSEFDAVDLNRSSQRTGGSRASLFYVRAGTLTVNLIMEALFKLNDKAAAVNYWNLLTSPDSWAITPDNGTVIQYLRILRTARASTETVRFIRDDLPQWSLPPVPGIFKNALRTCARDGKSPHAMNNAILLLELMAKAFPEPDLDALTIFFEVAAANNDADVICHTLDLLRPIMLNLRSMVNFGHARPGSVKEAALTPQERAGALKAMQGAIALYDRVLKPRAETKMTGAGVEQDAERRREMVGSRAKLAAFVTRWKAKGSRRSDGARPWGPGSRTGAVRSVPTVGSGWGRDGRDELDGVERGAERGRGWGAEGRVSWSEGDGNWDEKSGDGVGLQQPGSRSESATSTPEPSPPREKGPAFRFEGDRAWKKVRGFEREGG